MNQITGYWQFLSEKSTSIVVEKKRKEDYGNIDRTYYFFLGGGWVIGIYVWV